MQFQPTFFGYLRIGHLEFAQRVQHNLGDNQAGILLVIGGNNIPRRISVACGAQAVFKSPRVSSPVFPLMNVGKAEFPVLVRLVYAFEKSFALFFLRQVKEDFDSPRPVAIKMAFEIGYGLIALPPYAFLAA